MVSHRPGSFFGDWGIAGSPILIGDAVVQNCDSAGPSYLLAVDKKSGKTLWKTQRNPKPKGGWSTPILINTGTRQELVLNGEFGVKGYDTKGGKELWFCKSFNGRGSPIPFFAHGLIYTVNGKPGDIYAVKPGGSGDVTNNRMAWHAKRKGGRDLPAPAVIGDQLFVTAMSGVTTAYDAKSGNALWSERIEGGLSQAHLSSLTACTIFRTRLAPLMFCALARLLDLVAKNPLPAKPGEIFRATLVPLGDQLFIRSSRYTLLRTRQLNTCPICGPYDYVDY